MQTTTTTTPATATATTTNEKAQTKVKALVDTAVDVGIGWARFGLSMGRQALENNAKTLHLAAESLAKLATALEAKKTAEAGPAPMDAAVAPEPKHEA